MDARSTGINQVWGADFSYIRILNGFVYLAVILDLFSRRVVGWAISKRIDPSLHCRRCARQSKHESRQQAACITRAAECSTSRTRMSSC